MDVPSKCTIVGNSEGSVQTQSHRIANGRDRRHAHCIAQNTQKRRLYSMPVKLPIEIRKTDPYP
jgi:hypothetical protein